MILNRLKDKQRAAQEAPEEKEESSAVTPTSELYKSALDKINTATTR
jgi:hypothetical protein